MGSISLNATKPLSRRCQHVLKHPVVFSHANTSVAPRANQSLRNRNSGFSSAVKSNSDILKYNIKISDLGRHGKVEEARKLFDEMPGRDSFSFASMITVYLRNNDLPSAEKLFWALPHRSIVAESAMVDGYMKAGRTDEARKIFDDMPHRNVFSWTSLISGYFRSGQVDEARCLFDQMPEKNVVSWTSVFWGYARNGLIDQARNIFDRMPEKNIVAWTAMIRSYIENQQIDKARKLFCEMPQKNLYSWNIMISGCLDNKRVTEAVQLFNSMPRRDAVSWTSMVTGLARNGLTKLARDYFDGMPIKDVAAWNAMITAYVDGGLMVEARELFNSMPHRNIVTWNAMIAGYAKNGPCVESLNHFVSMLRSCIRPNQTTLTGVLTSCGGTREVMQVHALVISLGFEHETPIVNALITMYSGSGDLGSAWLAFENLGSKDVVSWTAMILAYSNHGYGDHALRIFARMLRSGVKPDEITFTGVLSGCSHAGLVRKGQRLFDSMSCAYGLEPKAEHYCCLVDILGRAGEVDKAASVVRNMPSSQQDGAVLGALLGACRSPGYIGLANVVGEKLMELEPTSSGGYILLANLYAARGNWDEFAHLRKKMRERNVKKVPGFSQIEVKGRSHAFFAGDKSHPRFKEIYGLLQEKLLPVMQEMVY